MKEIVKRVARRLRSYSSSRQPEANPKLVQFLTNLERRGCEIRTVFDIGACTGQWSLALKKTALPSSKFILFEANPDYRPLLQKTNFQYFCGLAISSPDKKEVLFFNGRNTGDSYYKENTRWYDEQTSIKLKCTTLDELVEKHRLPFPQFIKLDTQGSELDILSGASFLDKVNFIYCECPIINYNAGAPDMSEYLRFFRKQQFIPVDVFEIHNLESTLVQIDIMFVREEIKNKYIQKNECIRPLLPPN